MHETTFSDRSGFQRCRIYEADWYHQAGGNMQTTFWWDLKDSILFTVTKKIEEEVKQNQIFFRIKAQNSMWKNGM